LEEKKGGKEDNFFEITSKLNDDVQDIICNFVYSINRKFIPNSLMNGAISLIKEPNT